MTRQKYSSNEAINRILRSLKGATIPSDVPETLSGDIESIDMALSDIAELLEGSLPGETGTLPSGISVGTGNLPDSSTTAKGIIETATNAEAAAGTDTERAVTPAGLSAGLDALVGNIVEYGEIYNNSTGTAVVSLSTSWAKITGSFQGNTISSDNIVPDYANDRITVNHVGVLFVGLQASFSGGTSAVVEGAVYLDGTRQESIRFRRKLGTGGDVGSASALGIIQATGTSMDLEFYARADSGTPNFKLESGQIWVYGLP